MKYWKPIKNVYEELANDTKLSNREWELWKPIFAISKFIDEALYQKMKELAKRKAEEQRVENITETCEYILVETLLELVVRSDFYKIKDICKKMKDKFDDEQGWLKNAWVGRALKRLGFTEKRRVGTGVEIKLIPEIVKDLAERLGVSHSQTTQGSQPTPNSERSEGSVDSEPLSSTDYSSLEHLGGGHCDFCPNNDWKLLVRRLKGKQICKSCFDLLNKTDGVSSNVVTETEEEIKNWQEI